MNNAMIKHLVRKDLYLNRWVIVGYLSAGLLALALIGSPLAWGFNVGSIVLITIVIAMGFHMIMLNVVNERTEHTLPFVMSLPISAREYTVAKIIANSMTFFGPWLMLVITAIGLILVRSWLPNGLIPYTLIILGEMLVAYFLHLAVALMSESFGWTVVTIVGSNLAFQGFLYLVSHNPSIAPTLEQNTITWSPTVLTFLMGEIALIIGLLLLTLFVQGRKRDFI